MKIGHRSWKYSYRSQKGRIPMMQVELFTNQKPFFLLFYLFFIIFLLLFFKFCFVHKVKGLK